MRESEHSHDFIWFSLLSSILNGDKKWKKAGSSAGFTTIVLQTPFFPQLPKIFPMKTTRHKEYRDFVNQDNTHPNLQPSLAVLKVGELEAILSKG